MDKKVFNKVYCELLNALPAKAVLRKAKDGGFWIESPDLAGCFSSGDTQKEAADNFKNAVYEYFDIPKKYQDPNFLSYQVNTIPDPKDTKNQSMGILASRELAPVC